MQVATATVGIGQFTQQERTAVTQSRGVKAELVTGIGLGHRRRPLRDQSAGQQPQTVGAPQPVGVQAQFCGQRLVERQQPRVGGLRRLPGNCQLGEFRGEAGVQREGRGGG